MCLKSMCDACDDACDVCDAKNVKTLKSLYLSRVTLFTKNSTASHLLSHVSHVVTPCDGIQQPFENEKENV